MKETRGTVQLCVQIRGGPEHSFDYFSLQIRNNQISRLHRLVSHAARLDDN